MIRTRIPHKLPIGLTLRTITAAFFIGLLLAGCTAAQPPGTPAPAAAVIATSLPIPTTPLRAEVVLEAAGLVTALEFDADGRLFFAEKSGGVYVLLPDSTGAPSRQKILQLTVAEGPENGLLGLALAPDFAASHHFYLYYNVPNSARQPVASRIMRYTESNYQAVEETIIVDSLPAAPQQQYHFGGGLTFGPDGKLYLIFGDRNMPEAARDPAQLPGSVLRYNADGTIPADNPFADSPVYATGIRNGFGLAFNPQSGQLYETENGASCDDELNLILPGADYGWGAHAYDACPYPDDTGRAPLYQWSQIVAPAGLLFYTASLMPEFKGDLLVCAHNESALIHVRLTGTGQAVRQVSRVEIPGQYALCRITLTQGPDGWVYTATADSLLRIGR